MMFVDQIRHVTARKSEPAKRSRRLRETEEADNTARVILGDRMKTKKKKRTEQSCSIV